MFARSVSHFFNFPLLKRNFLGTESALRITAEDIEIPLYNRQLAEQHAGQIQKMVEPLTPLQKSVLSSFRVGGISHGAINLRAHLETARAMNLVRSALGVDANGPYSNSGEGGEIPQRRGTVWQSAILQRASAGFGNDIDYFAHAKVIEIKIGQGAKPGDGGEMPKDKVTAEIAASRHTPAGISLVSPPPHADLYSIEDLKQLIHDLCSCNPKADICVKLVGKPGIGAIAAGVVKAGANIINIAGPGGTGAATYSALHDLTYPWAVALSEVHQTLTKEGLRQGVKLQVSGGLQTAEDIVKATFLGADFLEFGTAILIAQGCVMARSCHNNDCPTGIATNNPKLIEEKFKGSAEDVARWVTELAISTAVILEQYGFKSPQEAVGRTDLLVLDKDAADGFEQLLHRPKNPYFAFSLPRGEGGSDIERATIVRIAEGERTLSVPVDPRVLSFGALLSYYAAMKENSDFSRVISEAESPVTLCLNGTPGQSLGFALHKAFLLLVERAHDGTGKSLSGGHIMVNGNVGNTTGFAATKGFIAARYSADRTFIRASGVKGIFESVGDFGANFMTDGTLIILGRPEDYDLTIPSYRVPTLYRPTVGKNFGAGFQAGTVVMPKALYARCLKTHAFAPDFQQHAQQVPISKELQREIMTYLQQFNRHIDSPLARSVENLLENPEAIHHYFCVLTREVPTPQMRLR